MEKNYQALVAYKTEFGDCLVPAKLAFQDLNLGKWVSAQRQNKRTLSADRIQRLDALVFFGK